jgi:mRNA-degrading endonuclease RelE of RelBE toxin-antitoxin system
MTPVSRFTILFLSEIVDQLAVIDRKYHNLIRDNIEQQLTYVPDEQTINRKPLDQPAPFAATWEIRFGDDNKFRVFYEVDRSQMVVRILGIGVKTGDALRVGGKEYKP